MKKPLKMTIIHKINQWSSGHLFLESTVIRIRRDFKVKTLLFFFSCSKISRRIFVRWPDSPPLRWTNDPCTKTSYTVVTYFFTSLMYMYFQNFMIKLRNIPTYLSTSHAPTSGSSRHDSLTAMSNAGPNWPVTVDLSTLHTTVLYSTTFTKYTINIII